MIRFGEPDHVQAELRELLAHRLFVEHAEHRVFAVNRRHDRDAEIDQPALVAHAETAVLRNAPLGDIEFAHDLDTRDDRRMPVLRDRRHRVMQHAVDAVLDRDFLVARFDVNIAGPPFQRVEDRGVHQLDDRRDIAVGRGQLVDRERLVGVLLLADDIEREAFRDLFENALRLLRLLQQVGDLRQRRDLDPQLLLSTIDSSSIRLRFRGSASAISSVPFCAAAARSCSGTSGRPGPNGTDRDRSCLRADRRTRSGNAPRASCAWCDS